MDENSRKSPSHLTAGAHRPPVGSLSGDAPPGAAQSGDVQLGDAPSGGMESHRANTTALRWGSGAATLGVCLALQLANWIGWGEDTTFRTFFAIYVLLPATALAMLVWWTFFSGVSWSARRTGWIAVAVAVASFFAAVRIDGVDGVMMPILSWRWSKTPEEKARDYRQAQAARTDAKTNGAKTNGGTEPGDAVESGELPANGEESADASNRVDGATGGRVEIGPEDWPQFRGPNQDGIVTNVRMRTDWNENPPAADWRRPCGLGWSSFALVGTRLFTQEQLDDDEAVVCYDADTGAEHWRHSDKTRLDTSLGGDGPRATPTVHDSKVYALGGTGVLNCLDAATGKKLWSVDIVKEAGIDGIADNTLDWGTSGSPLIIDDLVFVNPGISRTKGGKGAVAAYDRHTGKKRWESGDTAAGYATPIPVTIDSVAQIVVFGATECAGYETLSGKKLWSQPSANNQKINVAQPVEVAPGSFVISSGYGAGSMRFDVSRVDGVWKVTERWKLHNQFKLKFNDGVLRNGVIYGLDEGILACLDVETGKRRWRDGRYRYGEIVLAAGSTPEDDLLVVLTEGGECVLVKPSPEKLIELGRFKAITGTCWNHPVIRRGKLYVRSEQEMARYDVGR